MSMSAEELAERFQEEVEIRMKLGNWATLHAALVGCVNTCTENLAMGILPWPTTDFGKGDLNPELQRQTLLAIGDVTDMLGNMLRAEFGENFDRGAPRLNATPVPSDSEHMN